MIFEVDLEAQAPAPPIPKWLLTSSAASDLSFSRLNHQLAACEGYPDMGGRRSMPSALATRPQRRERGAGTRPQPRWWSPETRTGGTADKYTVHQPSRSLLALEASCAGNRDKLRWSQSCPHGRRSYGFFEE